MHSTSPGYDRNNSMAYLVHTAISTLQQINCTVCHPFSSVCVILVKEVQHHITKLEERPVGHEGTPSLNRFSVYVTASVYSICSTPSTST